MTGSGRANDDRSPGRLLALVGLLLRRVAREPIAVLGIAPSKRRLIEFLVGGLFMAGVGVINFVWQAHFKQIGYQLNPDFGVGQMLAGSLWVLRRSSWRSSSSGGPCSTC